MAPVRRNDVISRRRRRADDEGEEEGSQLGAFEDDSLSEGSVSSNGGEEVDAAPSDISEEESVKPITEERLEKSKSNSEQPREMSSTTVQNGPKFTDATAETRAMMNGLTIESASTEVQEIHFDDSVPATQSDQNATTQPQSNADSARESLAEKNRREHEAYLKERRENPAFVPTRGGFFLHDNRANPAMNGFRPPLRGRGRGRGQYGGAGVG